MELGNLGAILNLASGTGWTAWINMGILLIMNTIVGGIVIAIVLAVLNRVLGESMEIPRGFLMVLIINIINMLGIMGLMAVFPLAGLILPVLVWIILAKAFFRELSITHAVIVGVVGYAVTVFIVPILVEAVAGFIPSF